MVSVVGIDPGKKGAIAVYDGKELWIKSFSGDILNICDIIVECYSNISGQVATFVENVHAIYGSSAGATFEFGKVVGGLHACLYMNSKDFSLVRPKERQKEVIIDEDVVKKENGRRDTKATSINAAQRLFPEFNFVPPRCRKPNDGWTDAALIALYGYNEMNG